jgi:8-oxo-dGTP diphosphatase
MEYLNVYDSNKKKLNKKIVRGESLPDDEHILVTVIFIKNSDGKYLMQKTSKEKGSLFSTTGGHVLYNETSKEAIIREVREELNLDISNENINYIGSILFGIPFGDIYYLEKGIDISPLKLQKEEVESVSYLSENEILNLIKKEQITKSHGLMFKKLLDEIK